VPHTPFEIESTNDGSNGRVTLTGELDIATVPRVQQAVDAMLAAGVSQITIDLAGVGFVDSSGLRLFIVLDQRATSEGWTLALTRPTPQALTVFRVSGVEDELPFVEDASAT
jgi:anti-sigma B factor antagonist